MQQNLKAATFEVMETMFFLFPETVEEVADFFRGPGIRAWVPVNGPQLFRVGLTVPLKMAEEMTANLLGEDLDSIDADKVTDAFKEAANMLAGAFLTREMAPGSVHLLPPEAEFLNLEEQQFRANTTHLLFAVDNYGLEVFVEKLQGGQNNRMAK